MNKLQKVLYLIAVVIVAQCQLPCTADGFAQFVEQNGKSYSDSAEYALRESIFIEICLANEAHNAQNPEFTRGLNFMSDYTEAERNAIRNNFVPPALRVQASMSNVDEIKIGAAPTSMNWGDYCALTSIKSQGQCGACWAFASTAGAESFIKIRNGTDLNLSEEYVLECTSGSDCQGGVPSDAMKLITSKGIPTEAQYPYKASGGSSTKPSTSGICSASTIPMPSGTTYKTYSGLSTSAIQALIANSPVVVYFWADSNFDNYKSGVFSCSRAAQLGDLNHGVLVFGYDSVGNYLIKNSWGTTWGTNGFATVSVSRDCGITKLVLQYNDGGNSTVLNSGSCNVYQSAYSSSGSNSSEWRMGNFLLLLIALTIAISF